ncbi:MAG: hypothetical protein F6K19_01685 [Cyanothece sp. SIO1E1]|nr:hypothetical protein [Cyanothece sp. SIO1E1]
MDEKVLAELLDKKSEYNKLPHKLKKLFDDDFPVYNPTKHNRKIIKYEVLGKKNDYLTKKPQIKNVTAHEEYNIINPDNGEPILMGYQVGYNPSKKQAILKKIEFDRQKNNGTIILDNTNPAHRAVARHLFFSPWNENNKGKNFHISSPAGYLFRRKPDELNAEQRNEFKRSIHAANSYIFSLEKDEEKRNLALILFSDDFKRKNDIDSMDINILEDKLTEFAKKHPSQALKESDTGLSDILSLIRKGKRNIPDIGVLLEFDTGRRVWKYNGKEITELEFELGENAEKQLAAFFSSQAGTPYLTSLKKILKER